MDKRHTVTCFAKIAWRTTRAEVLEKLGTPSAEFEGQRILTYRIKVDEESAKPVRTPGKPGMFSLVLVFGDAVR